MVKVLLTLPQVAQIAEIYYFMNILKRFFAFFLIITNIYYQLVNKSTPSKAATSYFTRYLTSNSFSAVILFSDTDNFQKKKVDVSTNY